MRLYIAGPMTGLPGLNFQAFHTAAAALTMAGYEVFSPAQLELDQGTDPETAEPKDHRTAMAQDLPILLLRCDGVALLDGWHDSRGAKTEVGVAMLADMKCQGLEWWLRPETIAKQVGKPSRV